TILPGRNGRGNHSIIPAHSDERKPRDNRRGQSGTPLSPRRPCRSARDLVPQPTQPRSATRRRPLQPILCPCDSPIPPPAKPTSKNAASVTTTPASRLT